jgi:hypothetical protein
MKKMVYVRCGVQTDKGFKSIEGCGRKTFFPFKRDPRKRWLVNMILVDSEGQFGEAGKEVICNLCPNCARQQFDLHEEDYVGLEKSEALAASVNGRPS